MIDERIKNIKIYVDGKSAEIQKVLFALGAMWRDDGEFYVCNGASWGQCIPYEGNEHLLGTTDSPEE